VLDRSPEFVWGIWWQGITVSGLHQSLSGDQRCVVRAGKIIAITGVLAAGRMGRVEEMAAVAVFLASDESSFMYGSEIQADGGMNQTRFAN
jgi:NAD(P)-dependent dehydrogenase (short-subunit alcohol dehydrogenase family)